MKILNYRALVVLVIALSLVIFFFLYFTRSVSRDARNAYSHAGSFKELRDYFSELAKSKGGEYAYNVLDVARLPPNVDMHLLGHAVGDVLYSQKGVSGIATCTQNFRNACSHAMVIGAYNEFGEDALGRIQDTCKKAPGGSGAYFMCYHGLGHGIFAYYDYDLAKTVSACKKAGTKDHGYHEYVECVGGAIMELSSSAGHDPQGWEGARKRYLTKPLSPCMDSVMPYDVKSQCIMYLTPELWKHAGIDLGEPDPALFSKAFSYCDTIPKVETQLRESCFGSFGKEFVVIALQRDIRVLTRASDVQLRLISDWCSEAPHVFGENACISESVDSLFWGGENNPDVSFQFCGIVPTRNSERCFTSLAKNIKVYIADMERKYSLCQKIPEPMRTVCSK